MAGRIFHLEDGVDYARELRDALAGRGHDVVLFAPNVATALPMIPYELMDQDVNVVILDRDLPDGSGVIVARAIRESGLDVPIIANSGYTTDFGDYNITKLHTQELLRTVDRLCAQDTSTLRDRAPEVHEGP